MYRRVRRVLHRSKQHRTLSRNHHNLSNTLHTNSASHFAREIFTHSQPTSPPRLSHEINNWGRIPPLRAQPTPRNRASPAQPQNPQLTPVPTPPYAVGRFDGTPVRFDGAPPQDHLHATRLVLTRLAFP